MVFVGLLIRPTLVIVILICFLQSVLSDDPDSLLKFKKTLNDPKALDSWKPNTDPCDAANTWTGVLCSKGAVVGLRLGEMGLTGVIDAAVLKDIAGLRSISFSNNNFSGPMPEFNILSALKALYIQGNMFSGEIRDDYFIEMGSLKKLWMEQNKFEGPIPTSLTKLNNLKELHLSDNAFSGIIPPIPATVKSLNLSHNRLEGKIPDTLSTLNASLFEGNPDLCGKPLPKECSTPEEAAGEVAAEAAVQVPPTPPSSTPTLVGAVVTLVAVVLLLLAATLVVIKRRREFDVLGRETFDEAAEMHMPPPTTGRKEAEPTTGSSRGGHVNASRKGSQSGKGAGAGDLVVVNDERGIFGLPDLMKAAAEVLGNGSLGSAYKAVMTNGVAVVVKRMRDMNRVTKDAFDMEFRRLGALHHRNILTPLAYHYRKEEKLVVYEYVPRGSLLFLLHGDRGSCQAELDWPTRLKIIHGIARGMAFLHTELAAYNLPHGNLKSSNIFLSSDFEPLLSDFGFWSVVNPAQATQSMFAFKAPEATDYQLASPKCDVYCFGIVILEILTGKFPSQYLHNNTGGTDVVQWVLTALIEGKETELFDPEIATASESYNEMEQLLYIGAACVEQNPEKRLTMIDAVRKIEEIQAAEGRGPTLKEEYAKLSAANAMP